MLIADGVNGDQAQAIAEQIRGEGAVPVFVAPKLGAVKSAAGKALQADASLEVAPSVVFDAVVVADGDAAGDALAKDARAIEFVKEQYRHCKAMLAPGAAELVLHEAGIPALPTGPDKRRDRRRGGEEREGRRSVHRGGRRASPLHARVGSAGCVMKDLRA